MLTFLRQPRDYSQDLTPFSASCTIQGWKMTLVLVAALPIVALISFATRPLSLRIYTLLEAALLRSGSLCEQALGGMRTLASFCGEEGEAAKVWATSSHPRTPQEK
jgi:hypothetical protein